MADEGSLGNKPGNAPTACLHIQAADAARLYADFLSLMVCIQPQQLVHLLSFVQEGTDITVQCSYTQSVAKEKKRLLSLTTLIFQQRLQACDFYDAGSLLFALSLGFQ